MPAVVRKLCGHLPGSPIAEFDQSFSQTSLPIFPPPERKGYLLDKYVLWFESGILKKGYKNNYICSVIIRSLYFGHILNYLKLQSLQSLLKYCCVDIIL